MKLPEGSYFHLCAGSAIAIKYRYNGNISVGTLQSEKSQTKELLLFFKLLQVWKVLFNTKSCHYSHLSGRICSEMWAKIPQSKHLNTV